MKTLILKIEYDGTNYSGWQIQNNANSIQEEIEKVLKLIFGLDLKIVGAGRTDSGVHASGQVATTPINFDLKIPNFRITKALNSYLPKDIRIVGSSIIDFPLDARFDAIAREYSYSITLCETAIRRNHISYIKYPLNINQMKECSSIFIGEHDFTTFSKLNEDTKNYKCIVDVCNWESIDENTYKFRIKANRFVYGMVRSLVGIMIEAGREKYTVQQIEEFLYSKNRAFNSPLAKAHGLILEKIYFPFEIKYL